jgi:hypothetical protein
MAPTHQTSDLHGFFRRGKIMTSDDENELRRLTDMLAALDATLPAASPLREALQKSGYALAYAFIDGHRQEIESVYGNVDGDLIVEK